MKNTNINRKGLLTLLALSLVTSAALANGKVISLSNQTAGNSLQVFDVQFDGSLVEKELISTGGSGTGSGLGSQGAVAYSQSSATIAAVNAGDNTVSVFSTRWGHIRFVTRFSSIGFRPVSVTIRDSVIYVLNQGNASHPSGIQGFRLDGNHANPISGGTSGLSDTYTNPAQISFSPNGRSLVVTEKGTNKIGVFNVNRGGALEGTFYSNSNGPTPFGFAFSDKGDLFVTEAFGGASGASAVSSYNRANSGFLNTLSSSVLTTQTAACWAAVSPDHRYLFAANAGSGTISTYDISAHGYITLTANSTPIAGSTPVDMALSARGRSLYLLAAGIPAIVTYRVNWDGKLSRIDTESVTHGSAGVVVVDEN